MNYPKSLPAAHERMLVRILDVFTKDQRIEGISATGSYTTDTMDQYSDIDLTIAINPIYFEEVMEQRFELVDQVQGKVAAFTGEHVGEPRLIISLYEPDLIHVDYNFVSLNDAALRVDNAQVLWERDNKLSEIYRESTFNYPQPDIQWIEDRFWIWVHYAATKIARGEFFETLEFISFLRITVLSPLALYKRALVPSGVRSIETRLPDVLPEFHKTVATADKQSLVAAFTHCISLYLKLREDENVNINMKAQRLAMDYFNEKLC